MKKLIAAMLPMAGMIAVTMPLSISGGTAHAQSACPILNSNWQAFVNAMPGPRSRPTLIVTGSAQVPTAGYRLRLIRGVRAGATQRLVLRVTPPRGAAAEVISNVDLRAEAPAQRGLRRVVIECRGRVIGRANVTWAY
ncbi:MAG TPA: hypothetical protein VGD10_10560 [Allosphingosinicella sp.]|uniref:hypothetical protein n=1 Tax=Allosphingosinicella sp. TaxID=2823234 RepID=UPI002ED83018